MRKQNVARRVRDLIKDKYTLFFGLIIPCLLVVKLTSLPPLNFNEGWVLSVAKNWAKLGVCCQLMNGTPVSAYMLNVGFPAIAPIALSFRLLGVGIWQGRLPGVLFTIGSLILIYRLARELYGRSVARGTIAVLLLMSIGRINPLIIGRQALGEMPGMFYLLAGYLCFTRSLKKPSFIFLLLTCTFWGLSLDTKLQALPFLIASLAFLISILSHRRSWRMAGVVGVVLIGTLISFGLMQLMQDTFLLHSRPIESQPGIFSVTAFVPVMAARIAALRAFLALGGVLSLLGMGYAAGGYLYDIRGFILDELEAAKLSILILAGSWMGWFLLLSIGNPRHLFPPVFLSGIFLSLLLHDLTGRFDFRLTFRRVAEVMGGKCSRANITTVLTLFIVACSVFTCIRTMCFEYSSANTSVLDAAGFINNDTPKGSLVETYDMELFFLLDRPYHYPPSPMEIGFIRRTLLREKVSIHYNPLQSNPDYLVVGTMGKFWHIYDSVLKSGAFRLVKTFGPYKIYRRLR